VRKVERIDPATVDALRLRDALARALSGGPTVALTTISREPVNENIALLIETGGSTGMPKVVALSAAAMRASAQLSNKVLGATKGDRWALTLPLHHIAGINQILRSIELESDPVATGGEFISVVPTLLYRALNNHDETLEQLRGARKVLIGGAAVSRELLEVGKSAGIPLVTSYGMTEMCGGCVYDGAPLPSVEVKMFDGGKIALKGPMCAQGYLNDEAETLKSFVDGWFITSDEGEITSDGKLIVRGRTDDVIISGGEKISPTAVTQLLRSRFPRTEIYVLGIPDSEWGQSLRVVMALSDEIARVTLSEIREIVGANLSKVAAPRSLLLLSDIPTRANGKIDLRQLASAPPTQTL
jgi:O-succinylbenzoic acid--CoA ligase